MFVCYCCLYFNFSYFLKFNSIIFCHVFLLSYCCSTHFFFLQQNHFQFNVARIFFLWKFVFLFFFEGATDCFSVKVLFFILFHRAKVCFFHFFFFIWYVFIECCLFYFWDLYSFSSHFFSNIEVNYSSSTSPPSP